MRPMLTKSISRCTSDRKPRLLVCLHSACQECFLSKLAEARREESGADEVFIDGDSAPFVPEVRNRLLDWRELFNLEMLIT